ncbi:MAG: Tryptophan synthase alpha chain [Labilithrix sp.]|nr:Tryptophan synthase alpha chain [Labilithrix sp.]
MRARLGGTTLGVTTVLVTVAISLAAASGCLDKPEFTTLEDAVAQTDTGTGSPGDDAAPADDAATVDEPAPGDPAHDACVAACPSPGVCEGATCAITCNSGGGPGTGCKAVTCPAGIPCQVKCIGTKACESVQCGTASSCNVECNGDTACGKVTSAAPATALVCAGRNACKDPRCTGDTCTIQCGMDSCQYMGAQCCATTCTFNGFPGHCN